MVLGLIGAGLAAAGSIASAFIGKSGSGYDKWDHVRWQAEHDLNFKAVARNVEFQRASLGLAEDQMSTQQSNWQREFDTSRYQWTQEHNLNKIRSDPAWQMRRRIEQAKQSGIHPLAALGAAGGGYSPVGSSGMSGGGGASIPGGGGISGGGHSAPMGKGGSALGDAVGAGAAGLGEMFALAERNQRYEQEQKLTNAELKRKEAETELIKAQSRTEISNARNISRGALDKNQTVDIAGNPRTTKIALGSHVIETNPGQSDAQVIEDRYGDLVSSAAGAMTLWSDLNHQAKGQIANASRKAAIAKTPQEKSVRRQALERIIQKSGVRDGAKTAGQFISVWHKILSGR